MLGFSSCRHRFLADIDIAVGDSAKNTEYFLSQRLSIAHVKRSRIAWICVTESMSNTDLLDRVFAAQSPSGEWKMLRGWFLPNFVATQVNWSDAFDALHMEKGEEPMKCFCRVDKIVGILSSLGVRDTEICWMSIESWSEYSLAMMKWSSALCCTATTLVEKTLRALRYKGT